MAKFSSSSLINIHTHTPPHDDEFGIQNISPDAAIEITRRSGQPVSTGIHPWDADTGDIDGQLSMLENLAVRHEVIAIGESGLDRVMGPHLNIQLPVLNAQAEIARRAGKPMIIHCVKAFPELISLRKSFGSAAPWIIHGFTANLQIMQQLIDHDFYISFGHASINPSGKLAIVIRNVPLERIFFETDDTGGRVSEIYDSFARSREIEPGLLIRRVSENFASLFNI